MYSYWQKLSAVGGGRGERQQEKTSVARAFLDIGTTRHVETARTANESRMPAAASYE